MMHPAAVSIPRQRLKRRGFGARSLALSRIEERRRRLQDLADLRYARARGALGKAALILDEHRQRHVAWRWYLGGVALCGAAILLLFGAGPLTLTLFSIVALGGGGMLYGVLHALPHAWLTAEEYRIVAECAGVDPDRECAYCRRDDLHVARGSTGGARVRCRCCGADLYEE